MKTSKPIKFICVIIAVLLLALIFTSCKEKNNGHRIIGTWEHEGNFIQFTSDGYLVKGDKKYPFSVNEEKVTIDKNGEAVILDYSINSNGTLTMNGLVYYHVKK